MVEEDGSGQLVGVYVAAGGGFDVVWSQDAFLHSGDREAVVREVDRVLVKDGGLVVFTDLMVAVGVDQREIGSILKRLKFQSLGDVESYRRWFEEAGFVDVGFVDLTRDMEVHYVRVLREMESRERELKGQISDEYTGNMEVGLRNWVEGARSGRLCWGIR